MTFIAILALATLLLGGYSLLAIASDQDDVDNHTNFR